MIYRVAQSPARFPWPTNFASWQKETERACTLLLDESRRQLRECRLEGWRMRLERVAQLLELKYHQCLMLLYRPSPPFPRPSPAAAIRACYTSANGLIRIHADLRRFANMDNTWLTAHTLFVSGITMLYCLWASPQVRVDVTLDACLERAKTCCNLLAALGKTWSVAENARTKLARLIEVTAETKAQAADPPSPVLQHTHRSGGPPLQSGNSDYLQPSATSIPDRGPQSDIEGCPPVAPNINLAENIHKQGANIFLDELSGMGDFFDLDWLNDLGADVDNGAMWNPTVNDI